MALSSGEAELYAIGSGVADSLFVRSLVMESRLFSKANICVFTDSTAGKSMAGRFGTSRKTKHVELRYLYVQELVQSGHKVTEGSWNFESCGHFDEVCEQGYFVSSPGNFWTYPQVVPLIVSL